MTRVMRRAVTTVLPLIAVTPAFVLASPPQTVSASASPSSVTVGVNGAASASVPISGGPITGSADGSGNFAPVSCSDPTCEPIAITLKAPSGFPHHRISLTASITFTAPGGNPDGLTGLDLWLEDGSGNVIGSSVSGSSPAIVAGTGLNPGTYKLEVSGEALAVQDSYTGTISASVPTPTPPAPVDSGFITGILPTAPTAGYTGTNEDAEPGMAVDGGGTFWVASDIEPYAAHDQRALAALSGSDVWKSTDDGQTWHWVAAPFNDQSQTNPSLGGEDTDIAVAPDKNSNGFYNIYVASLWIGSTNVAVSEDGGTTWQVIPVNGEPAQDRPWLAADGACVFYLSYHGLAPYNTFVDRYDTCNPGDQSLGSAVTLTKLTVLLGNIAPGLSNRFGKLVVDNSPASPYRHRIYQPMEGCKTPAKNGLPEVGVGCTTTPHMFIGYADPTTPGVLNFTDVFVAPVPTDKLFIWPDTIATDSAGNVYLAWFDDQHSYIAVSKDGGAHWSKPRQVNQSPALSSVYPTVAASTPGHVEVAFYGSTRSGDADNGGIMGAPNTYGAANWQLFWANSTDFGKHWTQLTVTPTIHTGVLCYEGGGCGQYSGDRNLLDDFGVAISPTTGTTAIAFDNDQPYGVAGMTHTDYATERGPAANTPEFPVSGGAVLTVVGLGAVALGVRRRRRLG